MKPEQVARSYDALADVWDSDDYPREYGLEQHHRAVAFLRSEIPSGGAALDIGCGSSGRIIDLLLDHGFEAEGLDISRRMLKRARARHPAVTFHHADIVGWTFPRDYAFITAWDSVWHVPLEDQLPVLGRIMDALQPGGVLIFTTGGVDEPQEKRDAAMGPPMYHAAPGIPNLLRLVDEKGCVCRHLEYDQHPELHVYLVVQKPAG